MIYANAHFTDRAFSRATWHFSLEKPKSSDTMKKKLEHEVWCSENTQIHKSNKKRRENKQVVAEWSYRYDLTTTCKVEGSKFLSLYSNCWNLCIFTMENLLLFIKSRDKDKISPWYKQIFHEQYEHFVGNMKISVEYHEKIAIFYENWILSEAAPSYTKKVGMNNMPTQNPKFDQREKGS